MECFQNIYPIYKPLGHVSIVSFDIALIFFYYRITEDFCFSGLKLWIYGQSVIHAWLAIVAFVQLIEHNPPPDSHLYKGRLLAMVLKGWWILFAIFLVYNGNACMTLTPLLYWWVGCGGLIMSISLVFDWKPPVQTNYELSEITLPLLPEIPFSPSSPGKCEVCPICLEPFNRDEIISVLSCHHFYHPPCIYEWLRKKLCCPVCRTPVEPGSGEEEMTPV